MQTPLPYLDRRKEKFRVWKSNVTYLY